MEQETKSDVINVAYEGTFLAFEFSHTKPFPSSLGRCKFSQNKISDVYVEHGLKSDVRKMAYEGTFLPIKFSRMIFFSLAWAGVNILKTNYLTCMWSIN